MYKLLVLCIIFINSTVIGQSFNDFLRIGISARIVAIGNAATGLPNSPFAVYWNPSSLGTIRDISLETTVSKLSYGRNLYALGVAASVSSNITIGLNWVNFRISDIEAREGNTEDPDFIFNSYYNYIALGSSFKILNNLYAGNSIKYISFDLGTDRINSFGLDLGLFYSINNFNAGVMLQDINSYYKLSDDTIKRFDAVLRTGISYKYNKVKLILDTEKIDRSHDSFKINGGIEVTLANILHLRTGLYDRKTIALGAGIDIMTKGNIDVGISYTYKEEHFSKQPIHFFSMSFKSSMKNKSKTVLKLKAYKKYTVTASILNVRSEPNKLSKKIGKLLRNDVVIILETKDGWAKIGRNNLKGWVSMDYLKKI